MFLSGVPENIQELQDVPKPPILPWTSTTFYRRKFNNDIVDSEIELSMTPAVELPDLLPYAAQWILKTRESRYLTRAATQGIIEDVQDLLTVVSQSMETQTRDVLHESGIDFDTVPNLKMVFSGPASKPFEKVASFHQQLQYYRKHFDLVVSVSIVRAFLLIFKGTT